MDLRVTLVLLLSSCAVAASENVGTHESMLLQAHEVNTDSAVVAMLALNESDDSAWDWMCSGVMVSQNVLLTSQHCIDPKNSPVDCSTSTFLPPIDPRRIAVTSHPSIHSSDAEWTRGIAVMVPPGGNEVCGRDLALVVLDSELDVVPLSPRFDAVEAGETYSAVSFGPREGIERGTRARKDDLEIRCVGAECNSSDIDLREWIGEGFACKGDSGSPALDASSSVAGILSRGYSGECNDPMYAGVSHLGPWIEEIVHQTADLRGIELPWWANRHEHEPLQSCSLFRVQTTRSSWTALLVLASFLWRRIHGEKTKAVNS